MRRSRGATPWGAGEGRPMTGNAYAIAASVTDPELPVLTLEDLGVLRRVRSTAVKRHRSAEDAVKSTLPGMRHLGDSGDHADVLGAARRWRRSGRPGPPRLRGRVRRRPGGGGAQPAWSSELDQRARPAGPGRGGISPARAAPSRRSGPVPLTLVPARRDCAGPRCGSATRSWSRSSAPRPARRCTVRGLPGAFEHVKEI